MLPLADFNESLDIYFILGSLALFILMFFAVIAFISLVQMIRVFPKKAELITALDLSYSEQPKFPTKLIKE